MAKVLHVESEQAGEFVLITDQTIFHPQVKLGLVLAARVGVKIMVRVGVRVRVG